MKPGNMQPVIKYLCFYEQPEHTAEERYFCMASNNKIDYISSVLTLLGYEVELVSCSTTVKRARSFRFYKGKRVQIKDGVFLRLFPTIESKYTFMRLLGRAVTKLAFLNYLMLHSAKRENVIVYHSLGYLLLIKVFKLIKRPRLILEVEELYADVIQRGRVKRTELQLISIADAYIFSTPLLDRKLNSFRKPSISLYGTYQVEKNRGNRFDDEKIHVVYAGTFDPRKGAICSIQSAEYLTANYHLHILGFGSEEEIMSVGAAIRDVQNRSKAIVTYDGLLKGEEYIRFIQMCDIGLSTQFLEATFNETSFPSKILSYLANGLRVVSVQIKAIQESAIGHTIWYYIEQSPQKIAETILSIDINEKYDSRGLINKLNKQFEKDLKGLLER